jgi:hypothetical protein
MNVKFKEIKTGVATNTKYTKLILYYTENLIKFTSFICPSK